MEIIATTKTQARPTSRAITLAMSPNSLFTGRATAYFASVATGSHAPPFFLPLLNIWRAI
jgi:hypothetical protein